VTVDEIKTKVLELLSHGDATKKEIESALWVSARKLGLVLGELQKDNLVYRTGSSYSLTKREPAPKKPKTPKCIQKDTVKQEFSVGFLRILYSMLTLGGSILSARNTSIYLATTFPLFWAYLLSFMIVAFVVASPATMVLFTRRKQYIQATGIGLLFAVVLFFSMGTTSIGMFNEQKEAIAHRTNIARIDNSSQKLYTVYEKQERDIQALIDTKLVTIGRHNKLISAFDTIDSQEYKTLSWNLSEAEKFIQTRTNELNGISAKKMALVDKISTSEVVVESFAEMLQRVFGWQASMVDFIISLMAAIFVDCIIPVAGSLALYLNEKKEE